MASFDFEGRAIPIREGDTIAAALFRSGVRIFSRSFKYHRPRGLYCGTGDCPNCSMVVDGEPAVRACVTPARPGVTVSRPSAWPTADRDLLGLLWYLRRLLPVGFYYKSMITPRWLWPLAERAIRRLAGMGPVPRDQTPGDRERRYHHPATCVIGAGIAGLSAALAAAERGEAVVICDEGVIGDRYSEPEQRARVLGLAERARRHPAVTLIERGSAIGIYEGPLVPIAAEDFLHLVLPGRVVVATGATERHGAFEGSDLPGVWLARGAACLAQVHGVAPGRRAVVVADHEEGLAHLETLERAGVAIEAAVVAAALARRVPAGTRVIAGGRVVRAHGRRELRAVTVDAGDATATLRCDALVLSLGLLPRDNLARQAAAASISVETVGDAALSVSRPAVAAPEAGFVCLCGDVSAGDLQLAWAEGFGGTELLKRYTTATMGPCQGAMCHEPLRAFAALRSGEPAITASTTARPPARPARLEDVAAGARYPLEWRTALHDRHLAMGATMEWAGVWKRPERYGDVLEEYRAVRERVSVMDVSTLGKYRVTGPDATRFLERVYPGHVQSIGPGRSRYALVLNQAGYVFDDGLICSLGADGYYLTFTSGGADVMESWLRDWVDAWGLRVRIANQTTTLGAINVAGPRARELLSGLTDGPIHNGSLPYGGVKEVSVAGVRCLVLRVGFVGELSYELHHPRLESERLWDALLEAGRPLEIRPHGLEALRLLRLEKGHIIVGQDTDFDSTPAKLGLAGLVKLDKADFVGRVALIRLAAVEPNRVLRAFAFRGDRAPPEGAQLLVGAERVGYLTSSRFSPVLGQGVALGWVYRQPDGFPDRVVAWDGSGRRFSGERADGPFYDPRGVRLRA
jgi:sarcosine oxidase subunit alpha